MDRTTKKIRRMADILRALETVERAKVGDLTREMEMLREKQSAILSRLSEPASAHGPFAALLSSQIGRIERHVRRLSVERDEALKKYTEATAREDRAADLLSEARLEGSRKREQRELDDLREFQDAINAQGRRKSPGPL